MRYRPWLVPLFVAAIATPSPGQDDPWMAANRDRLLALYTHLHTHPELSFKETNTAARVAEELRSAGAEVTTGVGKLGVVGVLKNGPGKTGLVRSDLDALPATEGTGLPYASKATAKGGRGNTGGGMQRPGHDDHTTCRGGVAP